LSFRRNLSDNEMEIVPISSGAYAFILPRNTIHGSLVYCVYNGGFPCTAFFLLSHPHDCGLIVVFSVPACEVVQNSKATIYCGRYAGGCEVAVNVNPISRMTTIEKSHNY